MLTQLPNRILLTERLEAAMHQSQQDASQLAICYLDLDGFKAVNDSQGHATGDKLLIEVAQRLKDALRGGDTVSRLGGDEFVLLLSHIGERNALDDTMRQTASGHCHAVQDCRAALYHLGEYRRHAVSQ
ncbi:diguanylate cyclase domain-containing protein [Paludibacterium denitrificans]|uniref:Diguanylate cyclase n=1 Tax=Paludibacterium denitrificans TaxID=2675226 RepID=A0A844GGA5_9NEIS|nr:GGDEF domain-containing protein [Paludibacterium denitrificans]MTD33535.1 diguanylate cyclase [Paludibacterium denitrificans]